MKLEDLTVEVRDKQLNRVGQIHPQDLDFELELAHNNVGKWKLSLPIEHELTATLRTPGSGIIVMGPGGEICSGPMTKPSFTTTPTDPAGTVVFEGVTDEVTLADRLAWPEPENPDPTNQTRGHDSREGPVESLMHAFVYWNLGPGAVEGRRNPHLTLGTNGLRGKVTKKSARFNVLGNLMEELASSAKLGFRVVQRGTGLVFETFQVADRSREIRLDTLNGTLAGQRVALSPPGLTRAIVAGQGELEARQFLYAYTDESVAAEEEWGRRIERFIDQRQTDDNTEHQQKADEVLEEEGFTAVAVQAVPGEDTTMAFGKDWNLGDHVTVVVEGQELAATVTGAVIIANREGFRIGVKVGDPTGFDVEASLAGRVRSTERRVSALERNAEGGVATDPGFQDHEARLDTLESYYPRPDDTLTSEPLVGGKWHRVAVHRGTSNGAPDERGSAVIELSNSSGSIHEFLSVTVSISWTTPPVLKVNDYIGWGTYQGISSIRAVPMGNAIQYGVAIEVFTYHGSSEDPLPRWNLRIKHRDWPGGWFLEPINFEVQPDTPTYPALVTRGTHFTHARRGVKFQNGWTDYGAQYDTANFEVGSGSRISLGGIVRGGTVSIDTATGTIFTLPVGCRPRARKVFAAHSNGTLGRVDVTAEGNVIAHNGDSGYLSLDGISFTAEQ